MDEKKTVEKKFVVGTADCVIAAKDVKEIDDFLSSRKNDWYGVIAVIANGHPCSIETPHLAICAIISFISTGNATNIKWSRKGENILEMTYDALGDDGEPQKGCSFKIVYAKSRKEVAEIVLNDMVERTFQDTKHE